MSLSEMLRTKIKLGGAQGATSVSKLSPAPKLNVKQQVAPPSGSTHSQFNQRRNSSQSKQSTPKGSTGKLTKNFKVSAAQSTSKSKLLSATQNDSLKRLMVLNTKSATSKPRLTVNKAPKGNTSTNINVRTSASPANTNYFQQSGNLSQGQSLKQHQLAQTLDTAEYGRMIERNAQNIQIKQSNPIEAFVKANRHRYSVEELEDVDNGMVTIESSSSMPHATRNIAGVSSSRSINAPRRSSQPGLQTIDYQPNSQLTHNHSISMSMASTQHNEDQQPPVPREMSHLAATADCNNCRKSMNNKPPMPQQSQQHYSHQQNKSEFARHPPQHQYPSFSNTSVGQAHGLLNEERSTISYQLNKHTGGISRSSLGINNSADKFDRGRNSSNVQGSSNKKGLTTHANMRSSDNLSHKQQLFFGDSGQKQLGQRSASGYFNDRSGKAIEGFKKDAASLIAGRIHKVLKKHFLHIRTFAAFKETQQLIGRDYDSQLNISQAFERYKKQIQGQSHKNLDISVKENNSHFLNHGTSMSQVASSQIAESVGQDGVDINGIKQDQNDFRRDLEDLRSDFEALKKGSAKNKQSRKQSQDGKFNHPTGFSSASNPAWVKDMDITDDDLSDNSLCRQMNAQEEQIDIQQQVFRAILLKYKHRISSAFYRWRLLSNSRSKGTEIAILSNLIQERQRIAQKQALHKWAQNSKKNNYTSISHPQTDMMSTFKRLMALQKISLKLEYGFLRSKKKSALVRWKFAVRSMKRQDDKDVRERRASKQYQF